MAVSSPEDSPAEPRAHEEDPPSARQRRFWDTNRGRVTGGVLLSVVTAMLVELTTGAIGGLFADRPPASCPGTDCDGLDPQIAGCGADAATFQPRDANPVVLQIRHSPRCNATWGRILSGEPGDRVTLTVADGAERESEIRYSKDAYTRMATVRNASFRVTVCAAPTASAARLGTWEAYCIHATESSAWR